MRTLFFKGWMNVNEATNSLDNLVGALENGNKNGNSVLVS
jgi:hypothetical protein